MVQIVYPLEDEEEQEQESNDVNTVDASVSKSGNQFAINAEQKKEDLGDSDNFKAAPDESKSTKDAVKG